MIPRVLLVRGRHEGHRGFGARAVVASLSATLTVPLALCSREVRGDEPIQKAFGQRLGGVFDPGTATRSSMNEHLLSFGFPPPAQIPDLKEFNVTVSPLS